MVSIVLVLTKILLTLSDLIKKFKHIEHLMTTEKTESRVVVQRLIFADGHVVLFFQILFEVSHISLQW